MILKRRFLLLLVGVMLTTGISVSTIKAASINSFNKTIAITEGMEITTHIGLYLIIDYANDIDGGDRFYLIAQDFEFSMEEYAYSPYVRDRDGSVVGNINTSSALVLAIDIYPGNKIDKIHIPVLGTVKRGTPAIVVDATDSYATSGIYSIGVQQAYKRLIATMRESILLNKGINKLSPLVIQERVAGTIEEEDIFELSLDNGEWELLDGEVTVEGKRGLSGTGLTGYIKNTKLYVIGEGHSYRPGSIEVSGIKVKSKLDDPTQGNLHLHISNTNMDDTTLTIGTVNYDAPYTVNRLNKTMTILPIGYTITEESCLELFIEFDEPLRNTSTIYLETEGLEFDKAFYRNQINLAGDNIKYGSASLEGNRLKVELLGGIRLIRADIPIVGMITNNNPKLIVDGNETVITNSVHTITKGDTPTQPDTDHDDNTSSGGAGGSAKPKPPTIEDVLDQLEDKHIIVNNFKEEIPYTSIDNTLTLEQLKQLTEGKLTDEQLQEILDSQELLNKLGLDQSMLSSQIGLNPVENAEFTDVSQEHWASDSIKTAAELGLVAGMPDGTFAPSAPLQLADTFTFLDRVLLLNGTTEMKLQRSIVEKYVTDKDHWAFANMASIASKLSEETLEVISKLGDKPITRELLAQVLYEITEGKIEPIRDGIVFEDTKDSPYKEAISYCARVGLLSGMDSQHMAPENALTRAELMSVLIRLNDMLK